MIFAVDLTGLLKRKKESEESDNPSTMKLKPGEWSANVYWIKNDSVLVHRPRALTLSFLLERHLDEKGDALVTIAGTYDLFKNITNGAHIEYFIVCLLERAPEIELETIIKFLEEKK